MPASMATKLGIQFARFAQYTIASNNAGTHGLRNAFANATNGSSSSWTPGLNSSGASSSTGTGVGGAKFQAGKGAHSSFQHTGKALTNVNASSASDSASGMNDEDDDAKLHSTSSGLRKAKTQLYSLRAQGIRSGLYPRLIDTSSTLHLIMPNLSTVRMISTSSQAASPLQDNKSNAAQNNAHSRSRSLSTSATQNQELTMDHGSKIESILERSNGEGNLTKRRSRSTDPNAREGASESESTGSDFYLSMVKSLRSGNIKSIRDKIAKFRSLPKEKLSTPDFNIAMQASWGVRDQSPAENVLKMYEEMIQLDCAPNTVTYGHVVQALCERDAEQANLILAHGAEIINMDNEKVPKRSDTHYHQALSILDMVHDSGQGFFNTDIYNRILYSCAIRGDAETACLVVERLSRNKKVTANSTTFANFMRSFARDSLIHSGESKEDFLSRRLQACEHVMEEFEVFRNSEGWKNYNLEDSKVWNQMIAQYITHGETSKAMELIEKMIEGKSFKEGGVPAPRPDVRTAQIVIRDLLRNGDIDGAIRWFERVLEERNKLDSDGMPSIPMPNAISVASLFKRILETLPQRSKDQLQDDYRLSLLPQHANILAANRAFETFYDDDVHRARKEYHDEVAISTTSWRQLIQINCALSEQLLKMNRVDEAGQLSEYSLRHIKRHVDRGAKGLRTPMSTSNEEADGKSIFQQIRWNLETIKRVIQNLSSQGRSADAASCFTYAAAITPMEEAVIVDDISLNHLKQAALSILYIQKGKLGLEYIGKVEDITLYIVLGLTYLRPAVFLNEEMNEICDDAICHLLSQIQDQKSEKPLENIDERNRNNLLNCVLETACRDSNRLKMVESLFDFLSKLPESEREMISVQRARRQLIQLFGIEKAQEMLQKIRPSIILDYPLTSIEAATVDIDKESISTGTNAASSETAATSFAGSTTPSTHESLTYQVDDLPAIQTIDVDFGQVLMQKIPGNISRRDRNVVVSTEDGVEEAFEMLMKSIEQGGIYPSPDAIIALIDQSGRKGNLERVTKLYALASKVVTSLEGDRQWQMDAWYSLENIMTAALAHGGDPKLASEHRHRLLNAGRAPSADTYGALITVIRDTTDEALIAEELFDESQRLGVRPTRYLYNTVLSKLSRARKSERAMQLFDEMRDRGIQPSSITYGAVLNACTRTGDIANAERFFTMMESDINFKAMAPPYNTMMQLYIQTRPDRERALYYYNKLSHMKIQPTTHTYKLLLDLYGSITPIDLDAMRYVFGRLISDANVQVQGNHWASLIIAHGIHSKNLERAIEIYHSIPGHVASIKAGKRDQQPDSLSFEALLTVFAEHQRIDLIEEYVEERKRNGSEMTAYIANGLIKAYSTLVKEEGLDKARAVFEEMEDPPMGIAADGNHPIQRQHISGTQQELENTSLDLKEKVTSYYKPGFHSVKREPSTFEAMIRAEMEHQNQEQANALVSRMQYRGYPPVVVARAQDIVAQHAQLAM